MSSHSKGPWHWQDIGMAWMSGRYHTLSSASGKPVCRLEQMELLGSRADMVTHADAALIAAAPELLEALRMLVNEATARASTSAAFQAALVHAEDVIRRVDTGESGHRKPQPGDVYRRVDDGDWRTRNGELAIVVALSEDGGGALLDDGVCIDLRTLPPARSDVWELIAEGARTVKP